MKKLLLLLAMPLMLSGCFEKEADQVHPTVQQPTTTEAADSMIAGTWIKSNIRIKFFDASGNLVKEEIETDENGQKYTFTAGGSVTFTETNGTAISANYDLFEADGLAFIRFFAGNESRVCKVLKLDATGAALESKYEVKPGANPIIKSALLVEEFTR